MEEWYSVGCIRVSGHDSPDDDTVTTATFPSVNDLPASGVLTWNWCSGNRPKWRQNKPGVVLPCKVHSIAGQCFCHRLPGESFFFANCAIDTPGLNCIIVLIQ